MPDSRKNDLDDAGRLATLQRTLLLDSEAEDSFDRLAKLASKIVNAPVSLVSLVEPHRQFFKSQVGLPEALATERQTAIEYSFCQHVVMSGEALIVDNAPEHPLVCENPSIAELDVIAYLGIPLMTADGWNLGSFCVIDHVARIWTEDEIDIMTTLAASVATEIQLRLDAIERQELLEQLQERNEGLDAFSHTVSHNLKNMISAIAGQADVSLRYRERVDKDDLLETLSKIHSLVMTTNDTINSLMMLSGLDNSDEIQLEAVSMFGVLEKVLSRLEPQIIESKAQISLPEDFPDCIGYGDWLTEVLVNYTSNAIKYGGTPPKIMFGADILPDGRVRYWIQDNGAGIAEADQKTLFKTFSRLAQNSHIEGHGLGLSIVKRIVSKLGGEVAVESRVGEGSRFSFILSVG